MADINNKLRLQIVTQLDAAGIKATKDQVDQLELGVRRAGKSGSEAGEHFGQLEKALGKLPGKLGEIGGKLGGLAGQAVMVAGAFSTGVEIGNKIVDVMRKWSILPDALGDLKKQTSAYNYELTSLRDSLAAVVAEEMKRFDLAAAAGEKNLKRVDDETAAYFRQAAAINGIRSAQGNAELMQIEREKFEMVRDYTLAGQPEVAEQLGRYYDVLTAELQTKQQLEQFDRESLKVQKDLTHAEQAYQLAAERAADAKARQQSAESALANFRAERSIGGGGAYRYEIDAIRDDELEKIAERAKRDADRAAEVMRQRAAKIETVDADLLARDMQRANLAAAGTLAIDRAAAAYDDYTAANGNPGNYQIDPNWSAELLRNSSEAYQVQRDLLVVCRDFGDRLEKLLELK